MAINANETFSIDLSLFGGQGTDMAPGNLPAGVSPHCVDMFFGAQYTATRPAFIHTLESALTPNADVLSFLDFPQITGQTNCIVLYSDGTLWSNNVQSGLSTLMGSVTPGVRFKASASFDKFFMAFRGLSLTSPFTDAQLAGGDVPRYINSLGHMWRMTSDAPGGGLSVSNVQIGPEDLVASSPFTIGPAITSITYHYYVPPPFEGNYNEAIVTLASSQTLTAGQQVQLYNIEWATLGGPQWANGVAVLAVINSTTFTIAITPTNTYNSATSGTFAYNSGGVASTVLTRSDNVVTAYIADTTSLAPTTIQEGWYVVLSDTQATAGAVPDGSVPFTKNELFQAIYPSSSGANVSASWLTGGQIYFYQGTDSGAPILYSYPGDGTGYPLIPPAATAGMQSNWACQFNPYPDTFLPGVPNNLEQSYPLQAYGVTSAGAWDNTKTTPGGYIPNNVGGFEQANWNMIVTSYLSIPVAGTVTFVCSHADGVIIGIDGNVTPGSGNIMNDASGKGHTKSVLQGYPIVMMNNIGESDGYEGSVVDTFTVTFPTSGTYAIEIDYSCHDDARTLCLNWVNSDSQTVPLIPTTGPGTAIVQGDGAGTVTVTLPIAVESLPIGSWLYLYLYPSVPAAVTSWVQSAGGYGVITVPNVNWQVGTELLLSGFTGSGQPSSWNGVVVVVTYVDGNDYQFNFASTTPSSGTTSSGAATPVSNQYPTGWVQVTGVPNTTQFTYTAIGDTNTTAANGVVYDYFGSLNTNQNLTATPTSGSTPSIATGSSASNIVNGFQVLSVDTESTPNTLTWYQAGFNDSYTGTHTLQVQPNSQVTGGPRSVVAFFINEDGAATPASYPVSIQLNGGTQYPSVQVPIGPPGTVARGVGFTPAYGSEYYVLGQSTQPITTTSGPIINLGTIIQDNATTNLIMDFSDAALLAGIPIGPGEAALGSDYGDLTSTIVLPPCLGVIEYQSNLAWYGELNCYPNHSMINMGFDGGYLPTASSGGIGPNLAGTGTNVVVTNQYNTPWINPNNVSQTNLATQAVIGTTYGNTMGNPYLPYNLTTQALYATNFNFSLSNTSTIGGLTVTLDQFYTSLGLGTPNGTVTVQLTKAGFPVGTAKTFTPTVSGSEAGPGTSQTLGTSTDLWGTTLSYSDVNSTAFGVIITFSDLTNPHPDYMFLNGVKITLYGTGSIANALPLGWDSTTSYNGVTPDGAGKIVVSTNNLGFAYQMNVGYNNMLSQPTYQDYYGTPIVLPNRSYIVRFLGGVISGTSSGSIYFVLYSPSQGVVAQTTVPINGFTTTMSWQTGTFSAPMPVEIPSDLVFYFYTDPIANTNTVLIDELEIIDAQQPVLNNQLRVSYPNNEFGYDNENGYVIGLDTSDFIAGCFLLRSYLYAITQNNLYVIQDNGQIPAEWSVSEFATQCGCSGPDAITTGQSIAWWMGRHGVQTFDGQQPKKVSQIVAQAFEQTNWNADVNSCIGHDAIQKANYFSFPTGTSINPNSTMLLGYRMADAAYNVPDVVHVSPYTGKIISTDLAMKWSPLSVPINSMQMCTRETPLGYAKVMVFAGGPVGSNHFGQLYIQDYWNYPPVTPSATEWNAYDADYGTIPWAYQTYFFFAHDMEQQPQLALYRKLFCYMSCHVSGVGQLVITPVVDSLNNVWTPLPAATLGLNDPGIDYEWGLNVTGNRMSLLFSGIPTSGGSIIEPSSAMLLTHIIVSARKDMCFPVRGAF